MGLVHKTIYPLWVTGIKCWVTITIYLLYGPLFFPSDAADSADSYVARYSMIPRKPFGWPMLPSGGTHEDKGPFGSGRPSFALFSKYLNSNIIYN